MTILSIDAQIRRNAGADPDTTPFGSVHWVEGNYGWALSGPKDRARLKAIAGAAYEQLEKAAPQRSSAHQLLSRRGS